MKIQALKKFNRSAYNKALEWLAIVATDHDWWESTCDYIIAIGGQLGFYVDIVGFNLDRGKSISLEGSYNYVKGATSDSEIIENTKLLNLAKALIALQKPYKYTLVAGIKPFAGYGGGSKIYYVEAENLRLPPDSRIKIEQEMTGLLDYFCHWAIDMLKAEYEYLTLEENLLEMADVNEYEFDEYGRSI